MPSNAFDERHTIYFYGHKKGAHACFSNFYPATFVHGGVRYTSSEQAMMHRKALVFGDHATADAILAESDSAQCKRLGRRIRPYNDKVWSDARYDVVRSILKDKFEQNPDLRRVLAGTGRTVLAEASPTDEVWGIGRDSFSAGTGEPWRGQNLLGKALMEVRMVLQTQQELKSKPESELVPAEAASK